MFERASYNTWEPSYGVLPSSGCLPDHVWLSTNPYNINKGENAKVKRANYHEAKNAIIIPVNNDENDSMIEPR